MSMFKKKKKSFEGAGQQMNADFKYLVAVMLKMENIL